MIDENYRPELGEVRIQEYVTTDVLGRSHLDHVRVSVRVRLPHKAVAVVRRRYRGTRLDVIIGEYDAAEIPLEIPLRLTDADLEPYLRWRDAMLAQLYAVVTALDDIHNDAQAEGQ